ncbi:MAG: DUF3301 domain-containing protein [Gammaproteobacteria bacterium]|nr:DUF3301 domain-containing protein [Gammaproteobacteria bacterium]
MGQALLMLAALGLALGAWSWSVVGRERVLAVSREVCSDLKLQRLDDSVALRGIRLVRANGLTFERRYEFEFSTDGADRRRGMVALRGQFFTWIELEMPNGPLYIDIAGGSRPS